MKSIAIIPARSGSKGIIDKNIQLINGIPMLAYTIMAAKDSGQFDEIHLSTDSEEYAKIGTKYGAKVPFLRSLDLAQDHSSTWDLVKDILEKYQARGETFENASILQPTSPLRGAHHIKEAFELMKKQTGEAVVGVCETEHSPLICGQLKDDLLMNDFFDKSNWNKPRQQFSKYYRINGAIYLFKVAVLEMFPTIYDSKCVAYVMPQENSIDIDSPMDLELAQILMKRLGK